MEELIQIFPLHLRSFCEACFKYQERPEEIRIRIGQPLMLDTGNREMFWSEKLQCLQERINGAYIVKDRDINDMLAYMSNYSLYAFGEEIRNGYMTVRGGHRIGITGRSVCENGILKTIRQISFLNIRIATDRKSVV